MDERETTCAPIDVPPAFTADVAGCRWARDRVGESGATIYRVRGRAGAPERFLKHGTGTVADDIVDEMVRLRWLTGRIAVPALVRCEVTTDTAWLLTTALPGRTAWQILDAEPERGDEVVDALAEFLRSLHAIPISDCPFDSGHGVRLAAAQARIEAGLIDEDDFDDARQGWSAGQVWEAMGQLLPLSPDAVVTHGDFSLDNVLIDGWRVVGCIDLGRVGVADRYQDLAILGHCLDEFDAGLTRRMFERYGVAQPDQRKVDFHLLLDELF
ncbi:aminoglycoside phosphotransferase [Sphingomonas sp. Leaf67]|uniref:APH(3')-I family aminoglycoside O-phosphotransferase n=1 Tax=Sphingomonas sp. Leaf67 TaxID=1736230 RepID=UPI0006F3A39B|nr:APH(3')-I family aminoglycoside O-phosphotransferase [Sphingomonas sp. Leaf67]KQN82047.1 aminoglycoside phosphotransferase [Sphingomonas sp. Leaf67]